MSILLKYLSIFLFSTFKFAFSCFAAVGYEFSFFEIFVTTTLGGTAGILIFTYLTEPITQLWFIILRVFGYRRKEKKNNPIKKKQIKRNRRILKIKKTYGLIGLSLLTPSLLSIPVGAFVAVKFYKKTKITLLFMITAVIFWSLIFSTLAFFNIKMDDIIAWF